MPDKPLDEGQEWIPLNFTDTTLQELLDGYGLGILIRSKLVDEADQVVVQVLPLFPPNKDGQTPDVEERQRRKKLVENVLEEAFKIVCQNL